MAHVSSLRGKGRWIMAGVVGAASLLAIAGAVRAQRAPPAPQIGPQIDWAEQGWTQADRDVFHRTSQGSHLMPLAWFKALQRLDAAEPFGADQLARYGYLPDYDVANTDHLPIGFVVDDRSAPPQLGMTCAACHTGEVDYVQKGVIHALRVDGAPASAADFQQFLTDLVATARGTLADPARWNAFSQAVLGPNPAPGDVQALRGDFQAWTDRFGGFMDASLPRAAPWGPGRLDAFGMIFNRVAGLDLHVPSNLVPADAPVSYPFLWDAPKQDRTQWNGLAPNGLEILGLVRNTGEVMGVFADFEPRRGILLPIVLFNENSVWFDHLQTLEEKVVILKAPAWPAAFPFDKALSVRGKVIFDAHCAGCHGVNPSKTIPWIWDTPVKAVGTDPLMTERSARISATGIYQNSPAPRFPVLPYGPTAPTADILVTSVVGTMLRQAITPPFGDDNPIGRALSHDRASVNAGASFGPLAANLNVQDPISAVTANQAELYKKPAPRGAAAMAVAAGAAPAAAYESRVLTGVWATAPYLHNGSVSNLWELLTPPARRKTQFMAGNRLYDPVNVGFRTDTSPSLHGRFSTSVQGNSAIGHDFGTNLKTAEKRALIEYMKTL